MNNARVRLNVDLGYGAISGNLKLENAELEFVDPICSLHPGADVLETYDGDAKYCVVCYRQLMKALSLKLSGNDYGFKNTGDYSPDEDVVIPCFQLKHVHGCECADGHKSDGCYQCENAHPLEQLAAEGEGGAVGELMLRVSDLEAENRELRSMLEEISQKLAMSL